MTTKKEDIPTYSLSIHDRLVLLNTLPKEGDVLTIRVLKELKQVLGLTEEELQKADVVLNNGQVRWNPGKGFKADIPIGKVAKAIIREVLEKLNKDKKLTEDHLDIWDMFC